MFHYLKNFKWGKIVLCLAITLTALQLLHLLLLNKLDRHRSLANDSIYISISRRNRNTYKEDIESAFLVMNNTIIDASGRYVLICNLFNPSRFPRIENPRTIALYSKDLALITQGALDQLNFLPNLTKRWQGLISIAVFIPHVDKIIDAIHTITHFRNCYALIRQYVLFHLVYPLAEDKNPSAVKKLSLSNLNLDCASLVKPSNSKSLNYEIINNPIPYPNNILRNVARNSVPSNYILVLDIDFLPSWNLRSMFINFSVMHNLFNPHNSNTVYVLPSFEAKNSTVVPRCKEDLIQYWQKADIRPFYSEICWKCQRPTNYSAWREKATSQSLTVAYEVQWKDPWEPFYIGHRSIPLYDERFQQYGFNRISQVCEMHVAGYKFAVLNEAFVVHHGFKTPNSFHSSKQTDQEKNRILYRSFKNELKTRYPTSPRRCY